MYNTVTACQVLFHTLVWRITIGWVPNCNTIERFNMGKCFNAYIVIYSEVYVRFKRQVEYRKTLYIYREAQGL